MVDCYTAVASRYSILASPHCLKISIIPCRFMNEEAGIEAYVLARAIKSASGRVGTQIEDFLGPKSKMWVLGLLQWNRAVTQPS